MAVRTIEWIDNKIVLLDQTLLPTEEKYLIIDSIDVLAEAIKSLRVRGAPAIGVAAAMGVALAGKLFHGQSREAFNEDVLKAIDLLQKTRPTAVNLFWALDRMQNILKAHSSNSIADIQKILIDEAMKIFEEDRQICRLMGKNGADLLDHSVTILTHCNAGALATADYGTALAVVYAAHEQGKKVKVFSDETRPLLQGARLTAWELQKSNIDVTVICDNMAASVMKSGLIDCVIVGADRIAANGDVANKIGTYGLAILAQAHKIPFYVAAPLSTIDMSISHGDQIPIEMRASQEITHGFGKQTVPDGVTVYNPAFDVTPNTLITAIVTEAGVVRTPFQKVFQEIMPSS
ncbi:S-methyl-5-thioribose-1-phosphate isomerase [candidate division KSB1 bacterium]|nr:S-methyl-5-thioribose-1-phosphate isomerase [candidate division KSB1 bacterium]